MIGLLSYGGFLPRYRLDRSTIFKAMGWFNPATYGLSRGEKTVACHDEDSITMAVAACIDCLGGRERSSLGGLYLGSSTLPFQLRQGAPLVATALDLPAEVRTADFGGSHRAGTTALLAALDTVRAGAEGPVLVGSGECRIAKAGSGEEHLFGDGAAALLVGDGDVIAEFTASHSVAHDFVDAYREDGALQQRGWEERWVKVEGFYKLLPGAIQGLLEKTGRALDDYDKVIYPCRYARDHGGIARKLGIAPEKLQDPLMGAVGDTGAAHPLLMLVAALEQAKPGDRLLLASFGNGCDVLELVVTDAITGASTGSLQASMERRETLPSYEKYSVFRELSDVEMGIRGETQAPTALSVLWRDRGRVLGLVGCRCTACGTPQYPPQRVCAKPDCRAVDEMEPYRFSDRPGTIFTFTGDHLSFSVEPPQIYGIVDAEGGGRLFVDFTDCTLEQLSVGQPIKMMLRRKYHDQQRGFHGYFWKATPANDSSVGKEQANG